MQIDPAAKQITYINSTDDVSSNYSVILPIGNNKDSPQLRVTKYLSYFCKKICSQEL